MEINKEKLLDIKLYLKESFIEERTIFRSAIKRRKAPINESGAPSSYSSFSMTDKLNQRVMDNISLSWQETLFNLIDEKELNEVDVYKKAFITKQTFSKIRSNKDYHPDKNTAIRLCFGLMLNVDESLDFLSKAGYTLSYSIKEDIVVRYFIEHEDYDLIELDNVLNELNLKLMLKY